MISTAPDAAGSARLPAFDMLAAGWNRPAPRLPFLSFQHIRIRQERKETVEIMQGKSTRMIAAPELACVLDGYRDILIDLGTGDGRFALDAARQKPGLFVIGVDACRENLRSASRAAPGNVLFAIANIVNPGCTLPEEISGRASLVTINFPWGSLRDALLSAEQPLLDGLRAMMQPGARLEVRLNASALAEVGWEPDEAGSQVAQTLVAAGFRVRAPQALNAPDLRSLPTTWAKRLAFSRRPQAISILARKEG
jgi:hypothetical protein